MTTVTQSTYTIGPSQQDGRNFVVEQHVLSDGRTVLFEYLADQGIDPSAIMSMRAARVQEEIQANEAAVGVASSGTVPWTKFQFRQRFSYAEQLAIDEFNATFETNSLLTPEQKRQIRTGLKNLEASGSVFRDNPATVAGLQLYEALGLIASGRAAEILNG